MQDQGRIPAARLAQQATYERIRAVAERYGPPGGGLTAAEMSVFSQNGEDGVIAEVLRRVGTGPKYFVEFGGGDGRIQNCVFLADVMGWRGLWIEASAERARRARAKYRHNDRVVLVEAAVTPSTIDRLLADADVPEDADVLSIDVDGQDYHIWEALTRCAPRLVVIEYNAALGGRLVEPLSPEGRPAFDGTDFFGASIGALEALGRRKGYTLIHQELAGINAFFLRDDLLASFGDVDVIRRTPNFGLRGARHPKDDSGRRYVEV